ncbi:hypothetical protein Bpfe_021437 [Biomphalaria pfeifferi]|uniref:Uncharacterized protein n=1 Tax=Biomphalaria pfeifferi TaxID=112525 RepID=A0AAD8F3D9_BIOPF|nr:hypothetical protein Bpfe_021437 [Biomphalaria pfeifferi]
MIFLCFSVVFVGLVHNLKAATDPASTLNNLISGATTNTNCQVEIATCVTNFLASTATGATADAAVKCVDVVDCYLSDSLTKFKIRVLDVLRGIVQSFAGSSTSRVSIATVNTVSYSAMFGCLAINLIFLKKFLASRCLL